MQGLIVENISNIYKVKIKEEKLQNEHVPNCNNCNLYEAVPRGKFKKEEISPVVGDVVEIDIIDEKDKKAVIEKIYDRNVYIKRPKASNISQIVLVVSSKDPKPDLYMLDKQLAFSEFLGINTIIVLNKVDLDKNEEFKNIKNVYEKIGYKVLITQAKNGEGIEELKNALKNNINAFSGNSGVGKSTLINAIFNKDITDEGEISKKNKRGKNTTTSVKLYEIDDNTYIADTPGFSTFDISEIESGNLYKYYIDFKKEIPKCAFVGCTHIKENECGVKDAIACGRIDKGRYERYCKIYNELKEREERRW